MSAERSPEKDGFNELLTRCKYLKHCGKIDAMGFGENEINRSRTHETLSHLHTHAYNNISISTRDVGTVNITN